MKKHDGAKSLLKEKAYTRLKAAILTEKFPPGSFLSERKLVSELGMSKTPIKAALERLEHDGMVAVSPQQGIIVRDLTLRDAVDLFEFRIALESYAIGKICGALQPQAIAALRKNLKDQASALDNHDIVGYTHHDADYHIMLCGTLENAQISKSLEDARDKLFRTALKVSQRNAQRLIDGHREHCRLLDLLEQGLRIEAIDCICSHLEEGKRSLVG